MVSSNHNRNPARAVRRLIHMSTEQHKALRRLSRRTGVSQSQMFRRGLDLVIAEYSKHKREDR